MAPEARAVRLHQDGRNSVGTVDKRAEAAHVARRAGRETPPHSLPGSTSTFQDVVRVVGLVIAAQPVAVPDHEPRPKPRTPRPPRPRGALPAPCPDLAVVEVRGTA